MPGFAYIPIGNTVPPTPRFRHYLSFAGDRQTHVGFFTLPTSGSVSETGVGFQPDALIVYGNMSADSQDDYARMHIGVAAGGDQWGGSIYGNYLGLAGGSFPWKNSHWTNDHIITGLYGDNDTFPNNAIGYTATLDSFDADGFTITVDDPPLNTSNVFYIALKGGNYACGTAQSPASNGSQSITGLGFEPTAIMFASAQHSALGFQAGFHRLSIGAGDIDVNTNVWSGATNNDVYHDSVATLDKVLSQFLDTDFNGPFTVDPRAEAEIASMDTDGFTLDWSGVDTQMYYSWFAVDDLAEVGYWDYGAAIFNGPIVPILQPTKKVNTRWMPKGLIIYANDLGSTDRTSAFTQGDAMGFGACDEFFSQWHTGYMTVSPPFIGDNQINENHYLNEAFGAGHRLGGALSAPDFGRDRGYIAAWIPKEIQQIIRYRW